MAFRTPLHSGMIAGQQLDRATIAAAASLRDHPDVALGCEFSSQSHFTYFVLAGAGCLRLGFVALASSIQAGAWSLAFSQPRTSRSTPAVTRRSASAGEEQEMIDAQPCITAPGVAKIIPKGVDALVRVEGANGVGPSLTDEAVKGFAHLGPKQRIVEPPFRLINVEIGRHDVKVAGENDRNLESYQLGRI